MQEVINKILDFSLNLNHYVLYGIIAFFVLLALLSLIFIYKPRQKMPKLATISAPSDEHEQQKGVNVQQQSVVTAEQVAEPQVPTQQFFNPRSQSYVGIVGPQTIQGPEGTKIINLAQFAVSYKPDLTQNNELVEEEVDEVDEAKTVVENGKNYEIVTKKSFQAKLIQSVDETKEFYAQVADYIVAFGLKNRFAWDSSMFIKDKKTLAKIAIRGKTLCLYLALLPKMFVGTKYHAKDVSATKKFEATPLMVKIKSDRGVKFAKELIDEMMKSFGLSANISFVPKITAKMYPFDTTDKLIEQGLIKLVKTEVKPLPQN